MSDRVESSNGQPRTLSVEEAARWLGVSRGLAYQGVRDGTIPAIRLGRRVLVPTARLLALLGESTATGETETAE